MPDRRMIDQEKRIISGSLLKNQNKQFSVEYFYKNIRKWEFNFKFNNNIEKWIKWWYNVDR